MSAGTLWSSNSVGDWERELARYESVVAAQGVTKLVELDTWYRTQLPEALSKRPATFIKHDELVKLTEWKMARGVWRAPNLVLVRGNEAQTVEQTSKDALAKIPHPTQPVATLAKLDGVGPATASAVVAAYAPARYPFFDELVAAQAPQLGKVAWTLGYYAKYADALRERATQLSSTWTPVMVERALWAHVGGKAGNS